MASAWENRFAEYLRRLTGARESTALEVLPDLMPVLPVVDPAAVENLLAREERIISLGLTRTAAAGNLPTISVVNTTPGMITCVDGVIVSTSATQVVQAELTLTSTIGVGAGWVDGGTAAREFGDRRFKAATPGDEPCTLIGQLDQAGSIAATECFVVHLSGNVALYIPYRCVLTTGTGLRMQGQVVASAMSVTVFARERFPETAERQL